MPAMLLPVGQLKPGDQVYLHGHNRWFAIEEILPGHFKLFAVDDHPFTRWPVAITKTEYVTRR